MRFCIQKLHLGRCTRRPRRAFCACLLAVCLCMACALPSLAAGGTASQGAPHGQQPSAQTASRASAKPKQPAASARAPARAPSAPARARSKAPRSQTPVKRSGAAVKTRVNTRASSLPASSVPSAASSAAPASSTASSRVLSLPPVESVAPPTLGKPHSNPQRDMAMNLLGAGMWALVMILLVAILVAVHVGHRHHRRDVLPRNRYQSVRRDKKKRLLGDKYYHDSKYEK